MASMSNKAIEIQNLNIIYNDIKLGLNAVRDINFSIKDGEFVSIVGPSGCGKSTILKVLSDTLDKESTDFTGYVRIHGLAPEQARLKRKLGLVFQKPTLLEWRSVEGNISLPLEIMGEAKKNRNSKISKLLQLVELEDYAKYKPTHLSGGMQQRVSIARALAYNPEVLLMDEPFGALDEITRQRMNDELLQIWKETKKTIVFVTHSIEEAVYLSERIIVLTKQPGTVKEIVEIDLPYPRLKIREDIKFFKYITYVRKLL